MSKAQRNATNLHDLVEIRGSVSPHDYPWYCDSSGVTDCTSSLQACLAFAKANHYGVDFKPGTYKFSSPLLFDYDRACITFSGRVTLRYTGTSAYAVGIDGGAATNIWTVSFGRGNGPIIEASNATAAVYTRGAHHCHVEYECAAAITTALQVNFAVCNRYKVTASSNNATFVTRPVSGMLLDQRSTGEGVADCIFDGCVIEGVSGDGIVATFSEASTFIGCTTEGNGGRGYVESTNSKRNTLIEMFCEANAGADYTLAANDTTLINCTGSSTATPSVISGSRNRLVGGSFLKLSISAGATANVLDGAAYSTTSAGGSFADSGTGTIYRSAKVATANAALPVPDVARKPKCKTAGALTVFSATNATKCVVTIGVNGLDFGDSLTFTVGAGMTQLNGNTYQVEPTSDAADSFYLLSSGAYVDSTAWGVFSAGTAVFLPLEGTWVAGGAPFRAPGFSRDEHGLVKLHGSVKDGTINTTAFTLPVGYRPVGKLAFACANMATPGTAFVTVSAAGAVVPESSGSTAHISLDGVSFRAEQ